MSLKDLLLALLVILIWGVNFVVIKFGLQNFPPFLLAALRFTFVAFPACLLVSRPKVPLGLLFSYGLTISFFQFGLLFVALKLGMPAGLASLLLQAQAFFTLFLGAFFLQEKIRRHHVIGLFIAVLGMVALAISSIHHHQLGGMTVLTLVLTLGAALSWGGGNIVNKIILRRYPVEPIKLVVWSAFIPILPFFYCSWLFDGPSTIMQSFQHFTWENAVTIFYLAIMCTIVGYAIWGSLLGKYPTSTVAPLTLLVPVVGLVTAGLVLDETLTFPQIIAVSLIIVGLIINSFAPKLIAILRSKKHDAAV